jgi:hypothetical protein
MLISRPIGLDSQCLSYLIDAVQGSSVPSGDLAAGKIALFRTYLYTEGTLFVTPHVIEECAKIRNEAIRKLHESYINDLFDEWQLNSLANVDARTHVLSAHHSGLSDCRILAEAEDVGFSVLLTYDADFIRHLHGKGKVDLISPSEFWAELKIPAGAKPYKIPHQINPLSTQDWWRW